MITTFHKKIIWLKTYKVLPDQFFFIFVVTIHIFLKFINKFYFRHSTIIVTQNIIFYETICVFSVHLSKKLLYPKHKYASFKTIITSIIFVTNSYLDSVLFIKKSIAII